MKVAAIICEYNPFHNGHKYQIELIKKDFDAVICIMSSSFVQRGDIAIFDKWTRAKAAIKNGADLVLELPIRYSISSAKDFSKGAVEILNATNIVDSLVFGSEIGDIDVLKKTSEILLNETDSISKEIKSLLDKGVSFPVAVQTSFKGQISEDILSSPNNILAVEYLNSLTTTKSKISPITHLRTTGYFDNSEQNDISSATHIRDKIANCEDYSSLVPFDYTNCEQYDINRLTEIFKYKMLNGSEDLFLQIADSEPGIYNRFMKFYESNTFTEIINKSITKRYTRSRLRRIALRYVLDIYGGYTSPSYIRILGANKTGRQLLSKMKEVATLPIVTKVADFKDVSIPEEIRATDIAALCSNKSAKKGRDFLISPIML